MLGVLLEVFGPAGAAINNTHVEKGGQFFFSALYGKRLVVYPDCKNSKFGMKEIVRNCTSGDPVPIEFKGETTFTAVLRNKLFVASNPKPEFTSQTADRSRIIYIEVAESAKKGLLDEAAIAFEEQFHDIFDAHFKEVSGETTPARSVARILRESGLNNDRINDFKAWVERAHHVRYRPTREGRVYHGMAVVPPAWGR